MLEITFEETNKYWKKYLSLKEPGNDVFNGGIVRLIY